MKRSSNIIKDLIKLHGDIMDGSGKFVTRGQYLAKMRRANSKWKANPNFKITDRKYEFIVELMHLVMTTGITSENTKNYIKSHESSVARFVENYNSIIVMVAGEEQQLKVGSVQQNVNYDKNKLLDFFPDDIIEKVLYHYEPNMADYEKMLNTAKVKYAHKRKMLDNLSLNIPSKVACNTLSSEEFDELISVIAPYTKRQMEFISKNLTNEQIGYLNYLVSAYKLEKEDLERYKRLKYLLEGVEIKDLEAIEYTEDSNDIELDEDKKSNTSWMYEYIDEYGMKKVRTQYDYAKLNKDASTISNEEDFDIKLEDIDFGDITDADVE